MPTRTEHQCNTKGSWAKVFHLHEPTHARENNIIDGIICACHPHTCVPMMLKCVMLEHTTKLSSL